MKIDREDLDAYDELMGRFAEKYGIDEGEAFFVDVGAEEIVLISEFKMPMIGGSKLGTDIRARGDKLRAEGEARRTTLDTA